MTASKYFLLFFYLIFCHAYHVPPHRKLALMARYVVHTSDWASISTISTLKSIKGYPFVNLKSMSDGPVEKGKGIPYFYMTDLDLSGKDINVDNRVTVMVTLAQSDYCKQEHLDPQDPRCARIILTGKLVKVPKNDQEYNYAKDALFARHPAMKYWPSAHGFYVSKLNIEQICVLDFFGGVKDVSLEDYLNANSYNEHHKNYILYETIEVLQVKKNEQ